MHPVQEPHLVNNGEDGPQGQGIRDIIVNWCKSWAVDCEESCNAWFKTANKESEFSVTAVSNTGFPGRIPIKKMIMHVYPDCFARLLSLTWVPPINQNKVVTHTIP
ncbi:unnamed protein product [Porites lobata]|uniref:Uncharacterized protein n=1 Tax=Porites lobata TaxID=104759 RepID=A0ABN8RWP5_9CNID|nr:unnamed protein product [Porites lobata]